MKAYKFKWNWNYYFFESVSSHLPSLLFTNQPFIFHSVQKKTKKKRREKQQEEQKFNWHIEDKKKKKMKENLTHFIVTNLKQNKAQGTCAESTHTGVN